MTPCTPALTGATLGLITLLALPAASSAQQLWNIEEVALQPATPIVMDGTAISSAAAGAPSVEAATVQVTYDYLRLGMGYLEFPLPDGSVVEAENAVFEDRGGGNLMWTGEVPGAGYESVLFTVQDGHLVGWFGEPGGPKYVVYADPDGRGSLAQEVGPAGDWCGVEAGPGSDLVRDVAATADRQVSVASQSSDDRLDILTLYTSGTERYWRAIGGTAVGVRQLADYLNMVLRNGAIKETANLIPVRWDPKLANHPRTQGFHFLRRFSVGRVWHWELRDSPEVASLRKRHRPDLIHFIPDVRAPGAAGQGALRFSLDPYVLTGWSVPSGWVFAHEIGHNLGGHHEPVTFGDGFEEYQSSSFRPYRFGHTDMTSCAKRRGSGDWLLCPATIMSYGQETFDDPTRFYETEPFYSSVRHKPNGWTIGVAGTSEVERLFYETVPVAVVSGQVPYRARQYPRRVTGARWTSRDTVRVAWSGDWRSQESGNVRVVLVGGANDTYRWSDGNVTPIVRANGSQVGVDIAGLRPGGSYRIAVEGPNFWDPDTETRTIALVSEVFHLKPRGRVSGSPAAATQLGARVTGPDSVRLHWRDNSSVEDGYEVWYRKWSGEEPDEVWSRFGEPLPARTRYVDVDGLLAEDEPAVTDYYKTEDGDWLPGRAESGRYSFVVVAYNDKGWNASETFDLEFMPGPHPEPTPSGEITDCLHRETGIDLDGYQVWACLETADGARRRAWDYQLEADQSGLLYFSDRDDAEILVNVLDNCATSGHRWVFVAPVTTLPFRLEIRESGPYIENRRQVWYYDSERRAQDRIRRTLGDMVGNRKDRTARTVSDTTAFPCTTAEIEAARASLDKGSERGFSSDDTPLPDVSPVSATPLSPGAKTDCEPDGPSLTLRGGYTVSMCYETDKGEVRDARDWGLDSSRMGLLYFSDRNTVEALVKVIDGCSVNGHRWVYVAPATLRAFNLYVENPKGERWAHTNGSGEVAEARNDKFAFPCFAPLASEIEVSGIVCDSELCRVATGEKVRFTDISTGFVASRRWAFGDGVESNRPRVDHSWSEPGFYDVTLWVSDGSRESATSRTFLVESSDPAGTCEPGKETLCLGDSRYRVRARWLTADGRRGQAKVAYAGTNDSGLFWFFGRENWEVLIKVLDGCSVNGHVWVYGASTTNLGYSISVTDTVTGRVKVYRNRPGKPAPAITDSKAFPRSCSASSSAVAGYLATFDPPENRSVGDAVSWPEEVDFGVAVAQPVSGECMNSSSILCLQDGRYRVRVLWRTSGGDYKSARRVPVGTTDSGLYSFFDPRNWEMLIKVLDGCAVNGQHWVFAASATDLGFRIRVTDTETNATWTYAKSPGKPANAITDTRAFPDACRR